LVADLSQDAFGTKMIAMSARASASGTASGPSTSSRAPGRSAPRSSRTARAGLRPRADRAVSHD